jgi:hypothetical protein
MPTATARRVFWFDEHKTPNVADFLAREAEITLHRLAFDAPSADNWEVMSTCHASCITSARDEVLDPTSHATCMQVALPGPRRLENA